MRIIVTGGAGFVGRALVSRLADHRVVAIDHDATSVAGFPHIEAVSGDLADPGTIARAMADGCDAVIHLATVPGGAAEADPALAKRINIDATMALIEAAAAAGGRPRIVFASSVAVLGDPLPPLVDDATPVAPTLLYGAHKAMMEEWIATRTRRGEIDGLSVRLSGVVARPAGPSGMKTAFLSDVFHAVAAGERFTMPLAADGHSWLISRTAAVDAFAHALIAGSGAAPPSYVVTLPAVRARIGDLVVAIAAQAGTAGNVDYRPDAGLTKAFGTHPPIATPAAQAMGFAGDGDLERLVANVLADVRRG